MAAHSSNLVSRLIFRAADNGDEQSLASRYRRERFLRFLDFVRQQGARRILDVGGTRKFWSGHIRELPQGSELTLLNLDFHGHAELAGVRCVTGDARSMVAFTDGEFDVCLSNSVIEHASSMGDQLRMAREIRRVARSYFVQTPNRYFPLEPHFLVPFWQFLPVAVRARLIAWRGFGWMPRAEEGEARAVVESIRLLSAGDMRRLFPGCEVHRERFGVLTKSCVAMGSSRQ